MRKKITTICLLFWVFFTIIPGYAQIRTFDPFHGFHLGYTAQIGISQPCEIVQSAGNFAPPVANPALSWQGGIEASYHFSKYFGLSVGLNVGTSWLMDIDYKLGDDPVEHNFFESYEIPSLPIKFEFHIPINDHFWVYTDIGARFATFLMGISSNSDEKYFDFGTMSDYWTDQSGITMRAFRMDYEYTPVKIKTDLLFDFGFYYKLPYSDLIRLAIGANIGLTRFAEGYYFDLINYTTGTILSKDTHFDIQLSYIHNFKRAKEKIYKKPHWSNELRRHELMLSISDSYKTNFFNTEIIGMKSLPTLSLNYHYRMAKWCWIGYSFNYTHSYHEEYDLVYDNHYNFMVDLRFSYLNRKNITLYSGFGLGLSSMKTSNVLIFSFNGPVSPYNSYTTYQLTALGLKLGHKNWFGTLELGAGYKGYVLLGAGYDL